MRKFEKHLDAAKLDQYSLPKSTKASAATTAIAGDFCKIYHGIRPILLAILAFPLIPKKIKSAIEAFVRAADAICPL